MLTPQEVAKHTFTKAPFGGYNMAMVDEFLDILTRDYTALYKENATLKAKMKVLADKVEDYRSTEDAMRKALLTAQKMADQIVSKAQTQGDTIVAGAEKEAADKLGAIYQEVENEKFRLAAAQKATANYIAKLQDLFAHEQDYLAGLSELHAEPHKPDHVADAAQAIGSAVEKAVEDTMPIFTEAKQSATETTEEETTSQKQQQEWKRSTAFFTSEKAENSPIADMPEEPTLLRRQPEAAEEDQKTSPERSERRIDFKNLQSGKDYEIS